MSDLLPCRLAYEGNFDALKKLIAEDETQATALDEDGRSCLHWAITGKRPEIVLWLCGLEGRAKAKINKADESGWTPLHIASSAGQEEIVKLLLDRGAKVDETTETGQTALHYAASKNHLGVARSLLGAKIDVDARDSVGETALHRAAARGNGLFVKLLVDNGADVFIADNHGNTAMHCACSEDSSEAARILFEAAPELMNVANKLKQTPIEVATDNVARLLYSLRDREKHES